MISGYLRLSPGSDPAVAAAPPDTRRLIKRIPAGREIAVTHGRTSLRGASPGTGLDIPMGVSQNGYRTGKQGKMIVGHYRFMETGTSLVSARGCGHVEAHLPYRREPLHYIVFSGETFPGQSSERGLQP